MTALLFSYQPQQLLYPSSPKHWLGLPEPYGQWSPRFKTCPVSEFQLPFLRGWCWENSGQLVLAMGAVHLVPVPSLSRLWSWLGSVQGVFVKADFEALDASLPWGARFMNISWLAGESRI